MGVVDDTNDKPSLPAGLTGEPLGDARGDKQDTERRQAEESE